MSRRRTSVITVAVPTTHVEMIDVLVGMEYYKSRSAFIRHGIDFLLALQITRDKFFDQKCEKVLKEAQNEPL